MRRILAVLAAASSLVGGSALAYDVEVYNCAGETLRVQTYNENDQALAIPFKEYSIAGRSNATTSCNGATACKFRFTYDGGPRMDHTGGLPVRLRNGGASGPYSVSSC